MWYSEPIANLHVRKLILKTLFHALIPDWSSLPTFAIDDIIRARITNIYVIHWAYYEFICDHI